MRKWLVHSFKSVLQRLVFTFEQFSRLELANHAAAGAYAFLLSAMPALLIILYISSRLFVALDLDLAAANQFLEPYLGALGAAEVSQAFLSRPVAGIAGILGLLNLLWASRLFVVSIQRGLRVIYLDAARPTKLRENILTFVVELTLLFSVILIIAGSQLVQALVALLEWQAARLLLGRLVVAGITYLPLLIVWLFIFLTYLSMPKHKMRKRTAFLAATLCVLFYWLLSGILSHFLSTVRYGVLYGILGNLVSSLLKVFAFFWLYFFFAQLTYTLEFFDTLLFSRFRKIAGSERRRSKLEKSLFANPSRLFRRYALTFKRGELIFARDDRDTRALYLHSGTVGIYLDDPIERSVSPTGNSDTGVQQLATAVLDAVSGGSMRKVRGKPVGLIHPGEFFGEMAALLSEERTAWAVAHSDVTVFALPANLFERYLDQSPGESRKIIRQLAERLKINNEQLRKGETQ